MIICNSKGFGVFLPWKTASQTLTARMGRYDESPYSKFFEFNSYLNRVVHGHLTCADYMVLPESKRQYFLASFVRNPYDRAYSGFAQLREDIKLQPAAPFPSSWVRNLVLAQLEENQRQIASAGGDFDEWMASIREDQVFEAGRSTSFPLHPAHYWTHVGDVQLVHFVGKVEAFEADYARLAAALTIDGTNQANANIRDISGDSIGNPQRYRYAGRMNRYSRSKIDMLFARDFELFGYGRV